MTELLSRLAEACEQNSSSASIAKLLLNGELQCEALSEDAAPDDLPRWADLQMRLAMWRRVYPRLGKQPAFRSAMAREASAWVKRLQHDDLSV